MVWIQSLNGLALANGKKADKKQNTMGVEMHQINKRVMFFKKEQKKETRATTAYKI